MKIKSHWLLISGLSISTFFLSCMKPPDLSVNYGPQFSAEKLSEAIDSAQLKSADTILKDEFATFDVLRGIDVQQPELVGQIGKTVTKMDITQEPGPNGAPKGCYYSITLVTKVNEKDTTGSFKLTSSESYPVFYKKLENVSQTTPAVDPCIQGSAATPTPTPSAEPNSAPELGASFRASSYDYSGLKAGHSIEKALKLLNFKTAAAETETTTLHNLKVTDGLFYIPEKVKLRPNCGGLSNCTEPIKTVDITFDEVTWAGGVGSKVSHYYRLSKEVPYYAAILHSCFQYWISYQSRLVPITQCSDIRDFTIGQ